MRIVLCLLLCLFASPAYAFPMLQFIVDWTGDPTDPFLAGAPGHVEWSMYKHSLPEPFSENMVGSWWLVGVPQATDFHLEWDGATYWNDGTTQTGNVYGEAYAFSRDLSRTWVDHYYWEGQDGDKSFLLSLKDAAGLYSGAGVFQYTRGGLAYETQTTWRVVEVPEPPAWALMILGSMAVLVVRRSRHIASLTLPSLLLAGCATTSPQAASVLDSLPAAEPVTCQDCSTEWDRAQLWIVKHSEYKVQSATNVMIQTYNPTGNDPSYGFTVIKEPIQGGAAISMALACGNMFGGCKPSKDRVLRAFYHYVRTGEDVLAGTTGAGRSIQ